MDLEDFPDFYQEQYDRVNSALEEWLPAEADEPLLLSQAVRYSVLNGGKRLRGVLLLEAGRLGEADDSVVEGLAAAVEMIHAYSLVHDDLPAMDDDDFRRGKPANHREFGEDIAILAGDGLLTRAFYVLSHLGDSISGEKSIEILQEVTENIGARGLIGGQVLDLTADPEADTAEDLNQIHCWKTGALITASVRIGALAADLSSELVEGLTEFGRKIGLAFQIKDDLLDVTKDFETTGKPSGADARENKLTYPRLLGVKSAESRARELIDGATARLEAVTEGGQRLIELARLIVNRDR